MRAILCLFVSMLIFSGFVNRFVYANRNDSSIVGVKPGDFNTYFFNVTFFSNDTSETLSTNTWYQWMSTIYTCRVTVENVADSNITALLTYTYKNGTQFNATKWADLATKYVSDDEMAFLYFDALNSTLYNETITRTYLGTSLTVNHFNGGLNNATLTWLVDETEHSLLYNYTVDVYTNNSTGTLLEYRDTATSGNGTYLSTITDDIIVVQSNTIPWSLHTKIIEDINGDGKVDMRDIGIASKAFGTHPGDSRWNPWADIDFDGVVDLKDIALIASHFGQH